MSKRRATFGPIALAMLVIAAVGALVLSGGLRASAALGAPMASSAGCGRAATLASGTHTIQSSGQSRSYILRLPANYDSSHP
ncbi:MAG TPA: poly(3-hydroxybutyrate) depolymerase, partial [Actinocrinis sp.]|nr:poly(3-hydroxybutyrate) depolymerase [Actinocrinis sp.]